MCNSIRKESDDALLQILPEFIEFKNKNDGHISVCALSTYHAMKTFCWEIFHVHLTMFREQKTNIPCCFESVTQSFSGDCLVWGFPYTRIAPFTVGEKTTHAAFLAFHATTHVTFHKDTVGIINEAIQANPIVPMSKLVLKHERSIKHGRYSKCRA